jgi:hypothetical protein
LRSSNLEIAPTSLRNNRLCAASANSGKTELANSSGSAQSILASRRKHSGLVKGRLSHGDGVSARSGNNPVTINASSIDAKYSAASPTFVPASRNFGKRTFNGVRPAPQ